MWGAIFRFLDKAKRWVRYAYFLRFALALWLFAPLLCVLDTWFTKTLTSGIVTPETAQQYVCVAFFLVSAGFVALICARVVVINGPDRWDKCYDDSAAGPEKDDGRPALLKTLIANDDANYEWWALLLSQLPNVGVYWYLIVNGTGQDVSAGEIGVGLFGGSLLAGVVWYVGNAWYYLTYDAPIPSGTVQFGRNAARTLLFPRSFPGFHLNRPGVDQYSDKTIEGASTWLSTRLVKSAFLRIADALNLTPGYAYEPGKILPLAAPPLPGAPPGGPAAGPPAPLPAAPPLRIGEGHIFGAFSALMFTAIFWLMWPLTAPVPALYTSIAFLILLAVVCVGLIWVIGKTPDHPWWKAALILAVVAFFVTVVSLYLLSSAERFPILATILIMMTTLCWTLSGIAFYLDLYRVPVLTAFLLVMIVPRLAHWDMGHEEHYLSAIAGEAVCCEELTHDDVPTPSDLLKAAQAANPDDSGPLIIVTATGGGLHASAWTAEILSQLEERFDKQYPAGNFHQHLLLLSTVSGGSTGLLSYMRALHDARPGAPLAFDTMRMSAQCSSLEAIGWGLVYWDMSKAIVPLIPYFFTPSSGLNDLDPTPLGKDRTWSLRKGFARNANNDYCRETWRRDTNSGFHSLGEYLRSNFKDRLATNIHDEEANASLERDLTLRNLKPDWKDHPIPAFTMNTTSYEDGQRFLLANYRIPDEPVDTAPNYWARSFLETYRLAALPHEKSALADLPLATAAQMSATFPYVSSAARVPWALDRDVRAVHFVDGGYYDNDGTSSVLEFLRYALAPCQNLDTEAKRNACREAAKVNSQRDLPAKPTRILLIEIRNSSDDFGSKPENNPDHTTADHPNNLFSQLGAPATAFWQAGHESVTARTRVALAQLEHAFAGQLEIHRVVFADGQSTTEVGTDPLSWSLTPKQRREVRDSALDFELKPKYDEALTWFRMSSEDWKKSHDADSDWPE